MQIVPGEIRFVETTFHPKISVSPSHECKGSQPQISVARRGRSGGENGAKSEWPAKRETRPMKRMVAAGDEGCEESFQKYSSKLYNSNCSVLAGCLSCRIYSPRFLRLYTK